MRFRTTLQRIFWGAAGFILMIFPRVIIAGSTASGDENSGPPLRPTTVPTQVRPQDPRDGASSEFAKNAKIKKIPNHSAEK